MITITKETSKNLEGEYSLFISFKYNANLVAKVKSLPTRRYEADTKRWEVPEWDIKKVIDIFSEEEISLSADVDMEAEKPLSEYEQMLQNSEGEKWQIFAKELEFIRSVEIRNFAIDLLDKIPNYFYVVPASSTGKYHPQYALGEGGLVRHTKSAMMIANELLNNNTICSGYTDTQKDIVLVALLFHDSLKHGAEDEATGHTIFAHPTKAVDWIEGMYQAGYTLELDAEILDQILECISSHMGEWNKPYGNSDEAELPLPKTKLQKIVHLADYLASRKFLEVTF